ncbi:DUF5682 family protein [Diaphorobacter aerolatus]|uniref:Uncharacterized protein n=1 Tax=Diaphorobacter aerolatus TaxID=1288495 RepID=A0A7H0GP06_9BURK|nr:DUF5682 family protein [Diaphorobacter aerolatus]QNP50022.1 hypothetical protein H9K75_09335 [Diaphorobacter aerolatus]
MAESSLPFHFFGIRHHGPGSARSLLGALEALQPDALLIEGPAECETLLPAVAEQQLQPPVAMLVYSQDEPSRASFFPLAEFSPEWVAMRWAVQRGLPVRFMDLPQATEMALDKEAQASREAELAEPEKNETAAPPEDVAEGDEAVLAGSGAPHPDQRYARDPLDALAEAAGFADGETWWNRLVEERGGDSAVFEAVGMAMTALREELPNGLRGERYALREERREATMRQTMREAARAGFQRIAVICGAWHVPALQAATTAKADAATLKGLPRLKVQATWAPWTHRNLASASGYGAGVDSPGWYAHLWRTNALADPTDTEPGPRFIRPSRAAAWLARVAQLLRSHDLDCSSAHIIEATRLAEGLAALRAQTEPGLPELHEAVRTVICMGESAPLRLIQDALVIGDVLGSVPPDVPLVPLQRDLEQQQKTLRLKPEAASKIVALDLRKDTDLARSHLLHRLRLLGIHWGTRAADQQRNRGTFRESWDLQWQPELVVRLIESSRFGSTVETAAATRVLQSLTPQTTLPEIAEAIDDALLAQLPPLVERLMNEVSARAAITGDVQQLLRALPALANVYRYGSVRQTDSTLLAGVIDQLVLRAAIGLPNACLSLDEEAARGVQKLALLADDAIGLRDFAETTEAWQRALQVMAEADTCAALLRGMATRLLLDAKIWDEQRIGQQFAHNLSLGVAPVDAAAWLEGFLNRQALVLLHDDAIWGAVDAWLAQLGEAQFLQVLPLVRRSFADFSRAERQQLGSRAVRGQSSGAGAAAVVGPTGAGTGGATALDAKRASLVLPTLRTLWGVASER